MRRFLLITCALCLLATVACRPQSAQLTSATPDTESAIRPRQLELPIYADTEDVVVHLGYVASYNHRTLVPNWVAYELTADEANGDVNKSTSFSRDPDVEFPKASREDYANSGWDKGHMAPRADMKWSEQALKESCYFTNICPQDHSMNAGAWKRIEMLVRQLAERYGSVSVVCGPMFTTGKYGTIGEAWVHVPDAFFKALAVNTSEGYSTVAFVVDNNKQKLAPQRYAISVDSLETLIGRNLFPSLPDSTVEATVRWNDWGMKPPQEKAR
ncbi:MAG: DNA/RNA non-specific endonuclease [Bacteroidales bacterium]|nr:DNA/RNA non-specific endonuclease [Bacteroidales bacterium]